MPHVVVVEDDPSMQHLLQVFLEMEQFTTTVVDRFEPNHIVDALKTSHPDFLLMDVHLNGANGLDLLSVVRKTHRWDHVKIVMTSGEDCEDACYEAGANGFFLKPYNPMDLLNWLRSGE